MKESRPDGSSHRHEILPSSTIFVIVINVMATGSMESEWPWRLSYPTSSSQCIEDGQDDGGDDGHFKEVIA